MRSTWVLARRDAQHLIVAHPVLAVGPRRVRRRDRGRGAHLPDSRLKAKVRGRERPHRADVDRVHRVRVVKLLARRRHRVVLDAPVRDGELAALGDLVGKAGAARAVDAALGVERHARAQLHALRLVHLAELKARALRPVLVGLDLERAVPGLVADRAVERVVGQQELQVVRLRLAHLVAGAVRLDDHPVGQVDRAARLQARQVLNFGLPVLVELHLAGLAVLLGHAHAHQALPAVGRDGHGGVVAEVRQLDALVQAKLQELLLALVLVGRSVDGDDRHVGVRRWAYCGAGGASSGARGSRRGAGWCGQSRETKAITAAPCRFVPKRRFPRRASHSPVPSGSKAISK